MPFNGSGVYSAPSNSWAPAVASTTIDSADWNTLRSDLSTALSTAICKDGQTTITANLPMSTYRHTGVSNATALDQYATADQVVDNALCYGGASSAGTDTYAVNLAVSPGAYAAGQRYSFIADVANTGACTINFNTIGAASIKMQDGTDPVDNAIIANQIVEVEYNGTNMVLLNPAFSNFINTYDNNQRIDASGTTTTQSFSLGSTSLTNTNTLNIDTDDGSLVLIKNGSGSANQDAIISCSSDDDIDIRTGASSTRRAKIRHAGGISVQDNAPATPLANTLYANSMVKAWGAITYSGGAVPSIEGDVNISSVTDIALGRYRANYATAMAGVHYGAVATISADAVPLSIVDRVSTLRQTTDVTVYATDSTGTYHDVDSSFIITGTQ